MEIKSPVDHKLDRRTLVSHAGKAVGMAALAATIPGSVAAQESTPIASSGDDLQGQLIISTTATQFPPLAQQAVSEAYKAIRPNVELIWELQDLQASAYAEWLGTQLAAGEVRPDIVTGVYQKEYRNWVNYAEYRYVTNPHSGRLWDEDLDWNRAQEFNTRGTLLGLPTGVYSIVWFYNKDLFAKAGAVPPTNWDEFVAVTQQLKSADITPVVANFIWQVPQWLTEVYFDQFHVNWVESVRAQSGDWNFNPDLDANFVFDPSDPFIHLKYTFSTQRFLAALRDGTLSYDTPEVAAMIGNLAQVFPVAATEDFFVVEDPYPTFLQQRAAIMPNDTGTLLTLTNDMASLSPERLGELGIDEAAAFEWGSFLMPSMEGPLVKSSARSIEGSSASPSVINKNQAQTDLAVDFIMFLYSKAGFQPYLDAMFAAGSEWYAGGPVTIKDVTAPSNVQDLFKDLTLLGQAERSYNSYFLYWAGGSSDLNLDALNLFKSALEQEITPEDFASQIQKLVTDNFDAILEARGLTHADLDNPARQPGT